MIKTLPQKDRAIAVAGLAAVLLFAIIACCAYCDNQSSKVSEQHYRYALKAIEIADSYLDYDVSASYAYRQISDLKSREDELPDTESGDETHVNNFLVETDVLSLSIDLLMASYHGDSEYYSEVLEARNDLAERIGVKKRK